MMKLLLDEQITPAVAEGVRRLLPNLTILSLYEWEKGSYIGQPDPAILARAAELGWTLVTYDLRTIAELVSSWAEHGIDHAGVIFVPSKAIPSSDIGLLVHSIAFLAASPHAKGRWRNRIYFLRPERP